MAADIVLCVASAVGGCLRAPVGRHCGYAIFPDRYVSRLNVEFERLNGRRHDVQRLIDEALNNVKAIKHEVETWVKKVDDTTKKARDILGYNGRVEKTCFYGWLPNPKARHRLGRDAWKTVLDIKELLNEQFVSVCNESDPSGLVGGTSNVNLSAGDRDVIITDSQASILEGIVKALNDGKHKVIGVHGPGGVGKTTILKKVRKKFPIEGKPFHWIVYVEVSQTPDFNNIQAQIADAMGLDLRDKQSPQGRRDLLLERLQRDPKGKVLIIVDNLWDRLDLENEVGIPLGGESMKCILLLASRDKSVLGKMRADETFHLGSLSYDEAFSLFEKEVGDMLKDKKLKAKAGQVVRKLDGLPLLITSVAATLKCREVSAWEDMLIKIEDPNIGRIVKWSYDHLESEEAQSLFLLCGLIGGTIKVELLLGLGMGLGLFEKGFNNTVQISRNRLNSMLQSLCSICLLQDGGDDKENVTIHDLYSKAVVSTPFTTPSTGQNSLMINNSYGLWSTAKLEKCWAICLTDVGRDKLDKLISCQFPDLKILMLSLPYNSYYMPEHQHDMGDCLGLLDFKSMKELRVLCLCSMHITSLPSSIGILGNLRSLYLSNCNVEDVAILGKLKALQILSFVGSHISRLPKEIGELKNLRSLNLSNCEELQIIESGALKGLIKLEELYMKRSFDRWMGEDEILSELCNAGLAELKSLTKLTALEISIPNPTILFKDGDLPFGNLIRFWINIGNVEGREFKGLTTMKLNLERCKSILSREWVQKILQKTQYLHLEGLRESKNNAHELCTQGFGQLKHLDILNSPSIKYIVNSSKGIPLTTFTILESLFLENLINLEKICHGPVVPECFSKLKAVSVIKCDRLKNLWFLSEIQRLEQLEKLQIRECDSMQAIVTDDAGKDIVVADNRVELPNVCRLELDGLPNMTSFCTGAGIQSEDAPIQVLLPRLESLKMRGLLGLEKILYSDLSIKYSNLKLLEIAKSQSVEVVFDMEELKVTGDVEILSRLTKLTLTELPDLQRMWKHNVQFQGISVFRNLKQLSVFNTGLTFLFPVSVAKCLREIRSITVVHCPNMKSLILDEEGRDEETNDIMEFPLLEQLFIYECPMEKFFSCPNAKKESVATTSNSQDAYSDSFFDQKVTFPDITTLSIGGLRCKEIWNNHIPIDSFCKLESLKLKHCDNLLRVAPSHMWKRLQHSLEILEVESCRSIEIIYDGDGKVTKNGKLRWLELRDLANLRHIWQSDGLPNVPFPNLQNVEVVRCSRLEMLFATFTAEFLGQIEELEVESCENMELIAGDAECEEAIGRTITFSKLTDLRLFELPKFRSFLPEKYSLKLPHSKDFPWHSEDFPSLRALSIVSCGTEEDRGIIVDWKRHRLQRRLQILRRQFRDQRFRGSTALFSDC